MPGIAPRRIPPAAPSSAHRDVDLEHFIKHQPHSKRYKDGDENQLDGASQADHPHNDAADQKADYNISEVLEKENIKGT